MKLRDINGDGFVDLIFAPDGNYPPYHFGTALNLGNGTFAPTVVTNVFSCGEGTIDAADLDGDGDLDIVLTEEESCPGVDPHIFIFRNDGNQNFARMPDIVLPGRLPHGLALADVTGDGNIDIITALPDGMGVFPGNGNLTFGAPIISTTAPFKFKMADFNGDGLLDVGMIMQQPSFGTDSIGTALGNGNGTFQAVRTQTGSSVFENLRISNDLEPGDVNGDGTPDLIVFNYASNDVSAFIVNPDGSLRPHQRYGIGNTPILGTLADFNGDGRIDVAAAIGLPPSGLHNAIVLLRNVGGGPQPTPTPTPTATGTPPSPTPTATGTPPSPTPTANGLGDTDCNNDAHVNSDRDGNGNTNWNSQFDSNSNPELYTQTDSNGKTKNYAQAQADRGSSTLSGKRALRRKKFKSGKRSTSQRRMIQAAVNFVKEVNSWLD